MLLPTSWYICEYMQEGWFVYCEDGECEAVEHVSLHILLHSISALYYTLVKGSEGDVFFNNDNNDVNDNSTASNDNNDTDTNNNDNNIANIAGNDNNINNDNSVSGTHTHG